MGMNTRSKSRRETNRVMQILKRNQIVKGAAKISFSKEDAIAALKASETNKKVDANHQVIANLKK